MSMHETRLVFVYNAEATPGALVLDFLRKLIAPAKYPCNLCRVTYGPFAEKKEWAEFVKGLPLPAIFLHRDEFKRRWPSLARMPLPAVFIERDDGSMEPLAGAAELNKPRTLAEMKALILEKLA